MFPGYILFFTPHIFRLGGLFRDFGNVRDLDYVPFVKVSPYGTLTTKWNDVETSIPFLIRKRVLINDVKFFHQLWNLKKENHEIRLSDEDVRRLTSKPAVGQVF